MPSEHRAEPSTSKVLKSSGLGSEYDYVKGPVLLRVTGDLSPRKAKEYLAALS